MIDPQVQRQIDLEDESRLLARAKFRQQIADAKEKGSEAGTQAGAALLKHVVEKMSSAVSAFVVEASSGSAGNRNISVKRLRNLDADVVAFLTAKSVIDTISRKPTLAGVVKSIGKSIMHETMFNDFAEQKPALWGSIMNSLIEEESSGRMRSARALRAVSKYEVEVSRWSQEEVIHVGMKLLDLLIQSTGLVEVETYMDRRNTKHSVVLPTEDTVKWLEASHSRCELLSTFHMPMLVKPAPWTAPVGGGYLTSGSKASRLVRAHNKAYQEELGNHEMPAVYRAVNALQDTAWAINGAVLAVMQEAAKALSGLGKLPAPKDEIVPDFPEDKTDKEAVLRWRTVARSIKSNRVKRMSRRIALTKTLWIAEKFRDEQQIYMPHYLDFRGRAYPRPLFLNPQGPDYAKALLKFAGGKPVGSDEAGCWLAIYGANQYGFDKVGLQDRVNWTLANEKKILACASIPLDDLWWAGADKPWQFLAFCFEWAGFCENGYDHITHLPIALDGSCNGLQHFSMALRDEVGGAAVNLVPADKPQDIYQRVADRVQAQVCLDARMNVTEASVWNVPGLVSRKMTKKPVMTLPYGAKKYGFRGGVVEYLQENHTTVHTDQDELTYITRLIWNAIGDVVVAARSAMDFLRETARVAARDGLPVHWIAPSGFPVLQEYRELIAKRIYTQLGGKAVNITVDAGGGGLDKRRQASGISPNFVHSLDSAHMMATVGRLLDKGVSDFAMVHDSYGVHACDVPMLRDELRAAFVAQYRSDVLSQFRAEVARQLSVENLPDLPAVPVMGTLDPEAVLKSDFFFA